MAARGSESRQTAKGLEGDLGVVALGVFTKLNTVFRTHRTVDQKE